MLGLFMVLPVFALYAEHYPGSTPFLIGLALGVYGLSQSVLQIPFGLLSDRIGRKPVIAFGMLLFLAGSVICALAESLHGVVIGRFLQGAGAVASVIMALLSDVTQEQHRTRAMAAVGGVIGLAFALAMVLGPLAAGWWGLSGVFWLTAGLALSGLLIVLIGVPNPSVRHRGHEVIPVPAMIKRVIHDSQLLRLNMGIFALHFIQMATWVAVPVLLEQQFDFTRDRHWYLYLSVMAGGFLMMVPFIWYGETRRRMKPVFVGAIVILAVAEGIMAAAGADLSHMVLGLLLFFMAFNLLEASLPSLVSKLAPAGIKGTAMGVYSTSQFLGAFLGGVTGGAVAMNFGDAAVFWASLIVVLLWLSVAMTMRPPRYLRSLAVTYDASLPFDARRLVVETRGVEDVVVLPRDSLAYIKVDDAHFDQAQFDSVLQQMQRADDGPISKI